MFTQQFDSYACEGESITCEIDGFNVTARIETDQYHGAPWDEECGHGPVSDWTRDAKAPGQRVLCEDRGARLFYDFQEACRIALRDGWGAPLTLAKGETPRQLAARAAEHDFNVLRAWCNDDWRYCGIVLSVSRNGVELDDRAASLWGIELNYPGANNSYLRDVANELLDEALDAGRAAQERIVEALGFEAGKRAYRADSALS